MDSPTRILHVINACADGSISRIVERIISLSASNEFEWHVAAVKEMGPFTPNFISAGANVVDCSPKPGDSLKPWQKLNRYIRENKIRIIHSHTPRTIFEVWNALIYANFTPETPPVHVATKHLLTSPKDRRWGLAFSIFDRLMLYPPDKLITVSHTMAEEVKSQPGIHPHKVTAIPNAIPVEKYYNPGERESYRNELGLTPINLAIGYSGRISKVKNLDLLIKAFKVISSQYPSSRLLIAGEGDMQMELENLTNNLGIKEDVFWLGFTSNIPRFLSALDIYVQPSINEGLSLSILEAMAAEKPVIATRVGSAKELIEDKRTGLLINPGSVNEIANALIGLIKNEGARCHIAKEGKEYVFKKYNLPIMANGYYRIYRELGEMKKS